eukprot:2201593-Pleurochrysis_carterae.AAC.2
MQSRGRQVNRVCRCRYCSMAAATTGAAMPVPLTAATACQLHRFQAERGRTSRTHPPSRSNPLPYRSHSAHHAPFDQPHRQMTQHR